MQYEGNIIRPPSEADSILLQATVGCSRNKCTFCGTYTGEQFKIKSNQTIFNDINFASIHFKKHTRLFICDGDALIIPQKRLLEILQCIKKRLPWITRIGMYANSKSLEMKSTENLKELRTNGLKILYVGLESGDDLTLKLINKGTSAEKTINMCNKAKLANIKLSITVLLGISGKTRSILHAKETGKTLSLIDPEYVGALSLILIPGTQMYNDYKADKFKLPNPIEMLKELRTMIESTNLSNGLFHANHASNYLNIRAKLPGDKLKTLELIDNALSGKITLKPEWMRAL